jgi:hypothetical protein
MTDTFTIFPTTTSIVGEMALVILLFIVFCIYISYISAYNTGYKPNFVMFLNFLFDDYKGSNDFKTYIKNIISDNDSTKHTTESFTNFENITLLSTIKTRISNLLSNLTDEFQKMFAKLFINGNKIKINKRLNT